ncbi:MAG: hypothetical protein AB7F20_00270 [Geoalkalibacter sp.]|jgi:peptidoglycan/LPS O-acetylase OafA/YrhL|uniref:hypothetical protein n=1 Tax=Geoalkalibacter sp. TaxID=3041440 RepID=UPI002A948C71|nr:hypothetical protein [Thermodesulfobacteriota bacterium]
MDLSRIADFFRHLRTDEVVRTLQEANLGELITNPWFLAVCGVLALVALVMKWRTLLATLVGCVGFAWLLSYTMGRGTSLEEGTNDALLVFIGGGVLLVGIVIYLVFIRTD